MPLDANVQHLARDAQLLDASEQARAAAFRFDDLRRRFVAAHAALRRILAAELNANPAQLAFATQTHGKPVLAGAHAGSDLHFNLSHSGEWALVALAWGAPVGVDVEQVQPENEQLLQVANQFSPHEQAAMARYAPAERLAAFYSCWVRKEALLKGVGVGIAQGLNGFTVSLGDEATVLASHGLPGLVAGDWSLHEVKTAAGYAAALAVRGSHAVVQRTWDSLKN